VRALVLAMVLVAAACGGFGGAAALPARQDPVAAALAADDALRLALGRADASGLDGHFTGRALLLARLEVAQLAARGVRREEVLEGRRAVHTGGSEATPEVVLEIRAHQRWTGGGAGAAPPPFAATVRQWSAVLEWSGGRWLVRNAAELPPPQWWPVT
jgi:hypothetical protein